MAKARKRYVMIAAGGTGGHVFPGIAIAEEITRQAPGASIRFAGTDRGLEAKAVPGRGWPLVLIASHSIKDKRGTAKVVAAMCIPLSVLRALAIIASDRPALLIGIGGYAAGPLAVAAWMMRVPLVLVEPNAIPGLTNRMLRHFARRVFVAFREAVGRFGNKAVVTGTPVRREILEARHGGREAGARATVFVFGGSQGARRINRGMVDALDGLKDMRGAMRVIHQTGYNDDQTKIARAYEEAGIDAEVFPFTDDMRGCYERADIAVARAGANTVAELAALGIPSILVPYPFAADDHQRANAERLVAAGGAVMVEDEDFTGELVAEVLSELIEDHDKLERMRACALGFGKPDAAKAIAKECLGIAGM